MSSWLPSLFNANHSRVTDSDYDDPTSPTTSSDDLSSVFRGVATFLAPGEGGSSSAVSSSDAIAGIKNDLAEIRGSFKSGLSLISSKLTSNFLRFQGQLNDDGDELEEEDEDAVGITEEVVDFVRKLSTRPELWIDFPLPLADDFDMSDYQRDHAENIDYLVPELVTLRQKISSQISKGKFWIIYFILLFPRLSEEDLKLLSTPQVVEAREILLKKLQNKSSTIRGTSENHSKSHVTNHEIDKGHITEGDESDAQHKSTSSENLSAKKQMDNMAPERNISEEEKGSRTSVNAQQQLENENISFSDLKEDEGDDEVSERILGSKLLNNFKGKTSGFIQLNENSGSRVGKKKVSQSTLRDRESESEDSNDWLAVDDNDFYNLGAI